MKLKSEKVSISIKGTDSQTDHDSCRIQRCPDIKLSVRHYVFERVWKRARMLKDVTGDCCNCEHTSSAQQVTKLTNRILAQEYESVIENLHVPRECHECIWPGTPKNWLHLDCKMNQCFRGVWCMVLM